MPDDLPDLSLSGLMKDALSKFGDSMHSMGDSLINFFDVVAQIQNGMDQVKAKSQELADDVRDGIADVTNFKFDPAWKSRVVNVPIMIDQIRQFIVQVPQDIRNKLQTLGADLEQIVQDAKDAQAVAAAYAGKPLGGAKIGSWIGAIQRGFGLISKFIDDLKIIVDDLRKTVKQLETLDAFFLQQKNRRLKVGEFLIREGKLHENLAEVQQDV